MTSFLFFLSLTLFFFFFFKHFKLFLCFLSLPLFVFIPFYSVSISLSLPPPPPSVSSPFLSFSLSSYLSIFFFPLLRIFHLEKNFNFVIAFYFNKQVKACMNNCRLKDIKKKRKCANMVL